LGLYEVVEQTEAGPVPESGSAPGSDEFERFVATVEPGLRRALVAGFGPEVGRDAAVDALVWAWSHWARAQRLGNPGGYLYRVGQTAARRQLRRRTHPSAAGAGDSATEVVPQFEPGLVGALSELSVRQRTALMLVHGYQFSLSEAAEAMGCTASSVRNHVGRALRRVRRSLGVDDEV